MIVLIEAGMKTPTIYTHMHTHTAGRSAESLLSGVYSKHAIHLVRVTLLVFLMSSKMLDLALFLISDKMMQDFL